MYINLQYVELDRRSQQYKVTQLIGAFVASCLVVSLLSATIVFPYRNVPEARKAAYSAISDGRLIVFSGSGSDGRILDDLWSYNGTWRIEDKTKVWPSGRFNGCFLTAMDHLFIYGGQQAHGPGLPDFSAISNEAWTYQLDIGWTKRYPLRGKKYLWLLRKSGHACGYIPDQQVLYLYSGLDANDDVTNILWRVNLGKQRADPVHRKSFTSDSVPPPEVEGACAVSPPATKGSLVYVDGFAVILYVHGGRSGQRYYHSLFELSLHQNGMYRWRPIVVDVHPSKRYLHACTWSPNTLWIFGGLSGRNMDLHNDLWRFDTTSLQWTQVSTVAQWPIPRFLPVFQYNHKTGNLLIFGGETVFGEVNDVWELQNGTQMVKRQACIGCHLMRYPQYRS